MLEDTRDRGRITRLAREVLRSRPTDQANEHLQPARWLRTSLDALPAATRTPADRQAFIPRDPEFGLLQAHLDEENDSGNSPLATRPASWVARLLQTLLPTPLYHRFADGFHLKGGVDPEWAKSFLELVFTHRTARMKFPEPGPPTPVWLEENARVILVGDWGTGASFAQQVAGRMTDAVNAAGGRPVHIIHLGDVYYAGTCWEAENRFLANWPVPPGSTKARSWCLSGNHDMYAAGTGLFHRILTDDRFRDQRTVDGQVTSQLRLHNNHWQILGLDTSWQFLAADPAGQHGHLDESQVKWLRKQIPTGSLSDEAIPTPRTILLSHHPAFTNSSDGIDPHSGLLPATADLRGSRHRIDAWFWGHQHRLIKYNTPPDLGIDYAVCTGHGAVPEYARPHHDANAPETEQRFNETIKDEKATWYRPGFTVLDLDREQITVTYIDLKGQSWGSADTLPVR